MFTSRWNLQRREDLRIYDSAEYMEKPAEMLWIKPELVVDVEAPPRIVGGSVQPQWLNFTVDSARVVSEFTDFVASLTS